MKDLGPLNILRIPLHTLWESPDIVERIQTAPQKLEDGFVKWFVRYDVDVQQAMTTQLNWAITNPDYDFQSILKNVKTSNKDILTYFVFIQKVFAAHLKLTPTA